MDANPKHYNVPEPAFELFLLDEASGEKKITEKTFPKTSNASEFWLLKEDHTIGNLISDRLRKMDHVMVAGYKVPHPNVAELMIHVQTSGDVSSREVFLAACKGLLADLATLAQNFTREYELHRMANMGPDQEKGANGAAHESRL